MRTIFFLLIATTSLSGCASVFNTASEATSVAERHPITVDQQTVSIRIPVDPTLNSLSRESLARLDHFLTSYRTAGYGPITVTAPAMGQRTDLDVHETAANIRTALHAFGLAYEDMQGATYQTASAGGDVLVSFTKYVASGPTCGVFTGEQANRLRNLPSPNFGCATQANFAAMVADPRDLTVGQTLAEADGPATAASTRSTRAGVDPFTNEIEAVGAPIGAGRE